MYRVIVVDDESWSRQVVKSLVNWESLDLLCVGEAEDSHEGIELVKSVRPQIIITDMRMPGLSGVEWLQLLYESFPNIRIIVMSGYDDFVYLKQAIKSKALNYLLKPIQAEELNASLRLCIEQLDSQQKADAIANSKSIRLESHIVEKYSTYKKLIYSHLTDMNASSVINLFEQLSKYLNNANLEKEAREALPYKIAYDFISLLEEYLAIDQLNIEVLLPGLEQWRDTIEGSEFIQALQETSYMYEQFIINLQIARQKSKLNIEEVNQFIHHHFDEPISLETIAAVFSITKEHLSRSYKSITGENISDVILKLRMEKARKLILDEGVSIKRAAELCGYNEIAYFYKVFKKYYGTPPGELRK